MSTPPSRTYIEIDAVDWPAVESIFDGIYQPVTLPSGRLLLLLRNLPTEVVDLGLGVSMTRPIVPAAILAVAKTPWRGYRRQHAKSLVENLHRLHTRRQIYDRGVAYNADMTGLSDQSLKRELAARVASKIHPNHGPRPEKVAALYSRIDASTRPAVLRWAWQWKIDATNWADKATLKVGLASELGYTA
jgi:hypothetical protein